jgi:hypothetical protein
MSLYVKHPQPSRISFPPSRILTIVGHFSTTHEPASVLYRFLLPTVLELARSRLSIRASRAARLRGAGSGRRLGVNLARVRALAVPVTQGKEELPEGAGSPKDEDEEEWLGARELALGSHQIDRMD